MTLREEQNNRWNELTREEQNQYKEFFRYDFNLLVSKVPKINDFERARIDAETRFLINKFGRHNLRNQCLIYDDVALKLFKRGCFQYFTDEAGIDIVFEPDAIYNHLLNFTSKKQGDKLLSINMLLNVAQELNKDSDGNFWHPDWKNEEEKKYTVFIRNGKIVISHTTVDNGNLVYFRTEEIAKRAVQISGENVVMDALRTDY